MHTLEQHHSSNKNNTEKKIEGSKPVPQNQKEKQDQPIKIQQYVQANPASVTEVNGLHHLSTTMLFI